MPCRTLLPSTSCNKSRIGNYARVWKLRLGLETTNRQFGNYFISVWKLSSSQSGNYSHSSESTRHKFENYLLSAPNCIYRPHLGNFSADRLGNYATHWLEKLCKVGSETMPAARKRPPSTPKLRPRFRNCVEAVLNFGD